MPRQIHQLFPRSPTLVEHHVRLTSPLSHHLTVEARNKPAITALRLLTVLNTGFKNVGARHAVPEVAERRASCTDGLLTHFASPRGEKSGLVVIVNSSSYFPARNTRSARGGDCSQFRAFKESTTYGRIRTRNWLTVAGHHAVSPFCAAK